MNKNFKLIIIFLVVPSLIGLYFLENIKGYYSFRQYCQKYAGLKIYQKVNPNEGWLVDSRSAAKELAILNGVRFTRYKDIKTKEYFDVEYISGKATDNSSFKITSSNFNVSTEYNWVGFSREIKRELRLGSHGNELFDNDGNKLMEFNNFSYAKFNRDRMPLDMNPYLICDSSNIAVRLTSKEYWAIIESIFSKS